ncbi:Ig-like domain-containing protein [Persicitalea jodogahamensis]|uniref:Uncharacterized protein n=1 Tax=Persicitalea jodogahamensis TaxID=402147 RepID=A0A8J3D134_9BACT|nr:T9SS type A sorting domain-containing protein [Persicitalea jodogahamensis]GHB52675.1 hypothetical protein GCM10007390_01680 [Persicitalea jodogahamensis]
MQRKIFTYLILGGLIGLGWISKSTAQTITTGTVATSSYCVPATISVPFTQTGTFGATNAFSVELSGPTGSFSSPRTLLTTGAVSPLTATLPDDLPAGSGYRLRVVSSAPQVIGTTGATVLTIGKKPASPTVTTTSYNYCVGATATPLAATATGGNSLQWYNAAGTELAAAPTPSTASASTQTYSVAQVAPAGCVSEKVSISVQVSSSPGVPAGASSVQICEGSPASPLTATGNNLKWYDVSDNPLPGAPTPPNNAASTYKVTQTVNGCESLKKTIEVTIKTRPTPPAVTPSYTYCSGQTIPPLTATGTGLKWYTVNDTPLASAPTPSNTVSSIYKVSQTVDGCESGKATISVSINQTPTPSTTTSVEYCVGATSTALIATGGDIKWYSTPSGGTALATAPTPSTASAGNTNYYVSQTLSGCESSRVSVTVTVKSLPLAPTVASPVEICEGSTASPLSATGSNLKWYNEADAPIQGAPTPSNTIASSYKVSQTVNGCEGPKATIDVKIKTKPAAPSVTSGFTYCYGETIPVLTATGTSLKWYTANDTPLSSAPTPSNTANSTFKVSQTVNGCESDKASISVSITRTNPPGVASPVTYCVGETASALTASGSGLKWYNQAGTLLTAAPTPSTAAAGSTTYTVTQTQNGCESDRRASIQVVVNPRPASPTTVDLVYCQGATAAQLSANGSNIKWYSAATGGSGSATAPTPSTTAVGTTVYYVTQTNSSGCESEVRAQLKVTVNPTPALPTVATPPVEYCEDATGATALTATIATGNTAKWYLPGGTTTATAPTPSTATAQTLTYSVTQTNSLGCESPKSEIKVVINPLPALPGITNQQVCQTKVEQAYTLTATASTGASLKWYTAATGGTGNSTAPTISLVNDGLVTYYVSQTTAKGCEGERAKITVNIKPLPVKPTVPAALAYCQSVVASSLTATPSAGGTLNWYGTSSTGGSASSSAPVPSTAADGETLYYVSQSVNGCEGDRSSIKVTVRATPQPSVEALKEYCQNASAQPLTATGENLKWYNAASGGTVSSSAPIPATNQVSTTSFYVSQTKTYTIEGIGLNCESPRARINVQINPTPSLPNVTAFQEFCQERQDKTFTFSATGDNLKWYNTPSGGNGSSSTPGINLKNTQETSYFVSQTTAKGCEGGRIETKVRVKRLPALPGVTPSIEYCQFERPNQLTASAESNAALNWYGTSAVGGDRSGVAPTPSTDNGGETSFYVSQTLEGCEGDRTSIRVLIKTTPKPGVTTPLEYCQNVAAQPLSAQGRDLKWYREPAATESQTTPFTPFTANVGNYAFYVTQTGTNGCESPKEKIDVRIKPLPSATVSGDNSISLGASSQITVAFTGDGPWDYKLSNGLTGKGETQNPLKITVTPTTTTTYTVTEVANVCGKGIPIGSAIVTVKIPTISTGNPTIASLCAGQSFTLPFQQSGDFVSGSKFNVQISLTEADAGFRTIPTVTTGSDAVATVPDTASGGNYFVRVVSESPQFVIKGSTSPVQVTVQPKPTATVSGSSTILIGETAAINVAFTGGSPWTFNFNNGRRDSLITTSVTPFVINVKPDSTTTYKLSSVANSCGEGRVSGTARIQVDPILGTEPTVAAAWLKAYPSPVQTICVVEIETPPAGDAATLRVVDMRGRTVSEQKTRRTRNEVDFTAQPAGVYFIKVENGGRVGVRKILKTE